MSDVFWTLLVLFLVFKFLNWIWRNVGTRYHVELSMKKKWFKCSHCNFVGDNPNRCKACQELSPEEMT